MSFPESFIVDASVAAKWFVRENLHDQALTLLDHADRLEAPDLIVTELTNIAWKKCTKGEINLLQAQAMAAAIHHYIPTLHPASEFVEQALEIALELNHPVYDCLYLACAKKGSLFITADEKFCNAVKGGDFEFYVQYLGDID